MAPLVTGAGGFAGGHLIDHLLEHEAQVVAWGHATNRRPDDRGGRVRWHAVDVTDGTAVRRALQASCPSAVYHCAGIADVHSTWHDSARALQVNVMGTHHLLTALDEIAGDVPVLVTGSALVYQTSLQPLTEDSPIGPSSPYGVSKLAQEIVAMTSPGRVIVTRPFNHAGPRQAAAYVTSSFARQIAEAEAGRRERVLQVGNLEARRDITDVRDTVRAYRLLIQRGQRRHPYNVCRGQAYRVGDLLDVLVRSARVPIEVQADPARLRPNDNPVVLGDPGRLHADTGWTAEVSIEQTLSDLLDYWREHLAGEGTGR